MKPFEEQYTAWIDGQLTGRERAEFEALLEQGDLPGGITPAQAAADRAQAMELGKLLRGQFASAPALKNPDFFNAQILRLIESEQPNKTESPAHGRLSWSLRRLIWGGLGSLGAAALLFVTLVLPSLQRPGPPPEYYAQILNAKTGDPSITAVAIHSKKEKVTVLWLDGLDYVPAKSKN